MLKKLLYGCYLGLHFHWFYCINWIDHPEGKLGYWYCQTCKTAFNGYIHKPNPPRNGVPAKTVSAFRIRDVPKKEVKKFLKETKYEFDTSI